MDLSSISFNMRIAISFIKYSFFDHTLKPSMKYVKLFAPSVLRYGIALVVLWFGVQQFIQPDQWIAFIPPSITTLLGINPLLLVYGNATFEVLFGLLLLFGWRTRFVALLLTLHLFDIMWVVGYGQIGTRDFGLSVAALSIFMNGTDVLCIDAGTTKNIEPLPPRTPEPVLASSVMHQMPIRQ